jgi:ribosomal protein S27AE
MSFWEAKLNGKQPAPIPPPTRELFQQYQPVLQQLEPIPSQVPVQQYKPSVRMTQGSSCPQCGSDTYMTHGSYAVTCGSCGYHPRFMQEGSGMRVPTDPKAKAQPARQVDSAGTNLRGQIAQMNANQHANITNISQ